MFAFPQPGMDRHTRRAHPTQNTQHVKHPHQPPPSVAEGSGSSLGPGWANAFNGAMGDKTIPDQFMSASISNDESAPLINGQVWLSSLTPDNPAMVLDDPAIPMAAAQDRWQEWAARQQPEPSSFFLDTEPLPVSTYASLANWVGLSPGSKNIFANRNENRHRKENSHEQQPPEKHPAQNSLSLVQVRSHPYLRPLEEYHIPRQNFPPSFKQLTQAMLAQSTYGKDLERLLNQASGFRAINRDGGIQLDQYPEPPQRNAPFKGICNELAYSIGKQVQHVLSPSFEVKVATGTCEDYFPNGTHYYLLVWPKTKSEQIEKEIQKSTKIPKGCFLIDPSFKQMVPPHVTESKKRYRVSTVHDLEALHPAHMKPYQYAPEELPITLPIGFISDVAPEAASQYGPKTLLYLRFDKNFQDGGPPFVSSVLQQDPRSSLMATDPNFFDHLSPHNRFAQLYTKIVRSLHPINATHSQVADWQQQLFPNGSESFFNTQQPTPAPATDHNMDWLAALFGANG